MKNGNQKQEFSGI